MTAKKPENLAFRVKRFVMRQKRHDFDMENPIIDNVEIVETHMIGNSGNKIKKNFKLTGWKCKNCDKILWLDDWQMKKLPRQMKTGCA